MEIPVDVLEDIKILLKQCYFYKALEKLQKIEKELNFFCEFEIYISFSNENKTFGEKILF